MTDIIYDTYDNNTTNPDIVFENLQFKLKKFDFDKDIIFKNMTQIKKKKEDMNLDETMEHISLIQSYEFNYDNILEKLKEFFPNDIIEISDTMFIQLYLHLITNRNKRFIFKRKAFESFDNPSHQVSSQRYMDNNKSLLFVLYYENYHINESLKKVNCPYTHINLLKTGIDKTGFEVYSGLTIEGIYTMDIINWAKYIREKCKEWLEENKKISTIEYESHKKIEEDNKDLISYKKSEIDEFKKGVELYSKKKNIVTAYNYFEIGYFDILEFSNCEIKIAINVIKNMIIDIKK